MRTNEEIEQKIQNNKKKLFLKVVLFIGAENDKWEDDKFETLSS